MRVLSFLTIFTALGTAHAFATIVPPCQSAQNAVYAQQEAAWIRQCVIAQLRRDSASDAENNCRRWLETCRRAPPARPGFMTY